MSTVESVLCEGGMHSDHIQFTSYNTWVLSHTYYHMKIAFPMISCHATFSDIMVLDERIVFHSTGLSSTSVVVHICISPQLTWSGSWAFVGRMADQCICSVQSCFRGKTCIFQCNFDQVMFRGLETWMYSAKFTRILKPNFSSMHGLLIRLYMSSAGLSFQNMMCPLS